MADLAAYVYGRAGARSQIQPLPLSLTKFVPDETLHVREAATVLPTPSGLVAFAASPGHAGVSDYDANLYDYPAGTLADTTSLGVPTPDGNNIIVVDLTTFFGAQADGDYTLRISATDGSGTSESPDSDPFSLPLP